MSESVRLLTEEESAQIAEVSIDTIRKYRDCGLLDPIVKDNSTFFQELDIRTLFYAKFKEREQRAENEKVIDLKLAAPEAPPPPVSTATVSVTTPLTGTVDTAKLESVAEKEATSDLSAEGDSIDSSTEEPTPIELTKAWSDEPFVYELKSDDELDRYGGAIPEPAGGFVSADLGATRDSGSGEPKSVEKAAREASNLPAANELIEINKSLREQIQTLRDERDWLRERVEKLEARSEREQMLLLSESENVRKLISTTKKTFWQRALPWFGSNNE